MEILNKLKKPEGSYDFKGIRSQEYYLGGDIKITYDGDQIVELKHTGDEKLQYPYWGAIYDKISYCYDKHMRYRT